MMQRGIFRKVGMSERGPREAYGVYDERGPQRDMPRLRKITAAIIAQTEQCICAASRLGWPDKNNRALAGCFFKSANALARPCG